jgi:hypothetical protein
MHLLSVAQWLSNKAAIGLGSRDVAVLFEAVSQNLD